MDEKDLIKKLESIGTREISMPKNRQAIRAALVEKAAKKPALIMRLAPVFIFVFAAAAVSVYMKIDYNNAQGNVNDLGGVWCTYDDRKQGGESSVWPPASTKGENNFVKSAPGSGGKGYAVRITGVTGSKMGWDYFGVNTFLSPHATCPECAGIDLTRFTGIKFKIKGSLGGSLLSFMLPHEARAADKNAGICRSLTSYADYEADITRQVTGEWKEVKINFRKDLQQPFWVKSGEKVDIETVLSDANLIKWHFSGGGGHKVDVWIDKLEFY